MIRELIVVEGVHDVSAVRRAVDAQVLETNGHALSSECLERIRRAQRTHGVIVLTDPDAAGDQIRRRISAAIGDCRHAFLDRDACTRDGDIGVENASPSAIRAALERARAQTTDARETFTVQDLIQYGLDGVIGARTRRERVGAHLGIGYGNAARLLHRLNHLGVTREELLAALTSSPRASGDGVESA